ncbi:tetratricopeptide repeat protein [Actinoplanes oblitus]|uniref:Tetratricopeptide repeat protein n=1 Tax=Actinoplanes oblitus TaxID=3040509 RepID=A0ABY8WJ98_9ACTN|nr:tetratricopeptide repeat protein [Actinoplanes oblitus]WIM96583.1 tetratricopeptide repeat protein [Actinoplanes oblitus]
MKTAEELWGVLEEAHHLPYGSAQIALVEQVLRHADGAGDPALAFYTRLFATTAYVYGGESVKAFATFSWCVGDFDRNPQPYHERWTHNLFWQFKTMVSALTKFPEIPLARTYAVLDDMERRYREGGHGMQPVYKHRYLVARHIGADAEADDWFEKWRAAPRTSLSDCAGCDPTTLVTHLNARGRYTEAVELAGPVLAGDLSCTEQPQTILSELMVSYLRSGRPAEAADAHRRSYLVERSNLADLWGIGDHILFCARTGNEARGLEIVQRHIDWLDRAPSPAAGMNFAASCVALLRRLVALGHGDSPIRRSGRPDTTAAALADELTGYATELAARFDARNGTAHQSEVIAETMAAEPYGIELPLAPTARRAPRPATPSIVDVKPVVPDGLTETELLDLAEKHLDEDEHDEFGAVLAAYAERFPEPGDPLLAGRLWTFRGVLLPADDHDGTIAAWERAVVAFAQAGAGGKVSALRARIAMERARAERGDPAEDVALVRADVAYQEQHGDARDRANAWLRLSTMYFMADSLDEANEAGDRADQYAAEWGRPRRVAYHALMRARNRGAAHRHDEAREAARQAWAFYREHGPARISAEAATVFGQVAEEPAEVLEAMTESLTTGVPGAEMVGHALRGRALMALDRAEEAIDDFVEAVAICAEQEAEQPGAFARQDLAQAYLQAGRLPEAAEVAEEAVRGFERLGFAEPLNDTRFMLAGIYRDLGDSGRALELYRELIEVLADNPHGRGQVGEDAGQLLYKVDRDAEAALTFQAAAEALREAGDLAGELRVLRRRLMALNYADQVDEAELLIAEVTRKYAELPAELAGEPGVQWGRGVFAFEVGNLLMRRGRWAEALPHLEGAPERLRTIGATEDADRVTNMRAEALLKSGHPVEALALLDALAPEARHPDVYADTRKAIDGLNDR